MAHSLSAKKRVRQNAKRRIRNRARKSMIRTQMKHLQNALDAGNSQEAAEQFKILTKTLDKVTCTSTMHKKTAARMKSRMAKKVNALAAK